MKSNISGNTRLVEYGIQTDKSDLRAHVCVKAGRVYIYETRAGQETIKNKTYPCRPAYQQGIKTAMGYLVPPGDIPGCRWVDIPTDWLSHSRLVINEKDSPERKGDRAVHIVYGLIKTNRFPLFAAEAKIIEDYQLQISGIDVTVHMTIQVKCDFKGGHRDRGGTGNLYLQIAECNPFRKFGETSKDLRHDAA